MHRVVQHSDTGYQKHWVETHWVVRRRLDWVAVAGFRQRLIKRCPSHWYSSSPRWAQLLYLADKQRLYVLTMADNVCRAGTCKFLFTHDIRAPHWGYLRKPATSFTEYSGSHAGMLMGESQKVSVAPTLEAPTAGASSPAG